MNIRKPLLTTGLALSLALGTALVPLTQGAHAANAEVDASQSWIEKSNAYSAKLLGLMAKYAPEYASMIGVAAADTEVMDVQPKVLERYTADAKKLISELKAARTQEKDPALVQDIDIMIASLERDVKTNALTKANLLTYNNVPQDIYSGFQALLGSGSDASRHESAVVRLRKYAGLEEGYQPITELATARSRESFAVEGLAGPFKDEVEQDLEHLPVFIEGLAPLFEGAGLTGWQEPLEKLKAQLTAYGEFVRGEIVPRARSEARLPRPLYENDLAKWGLEGVTPETLIQMASLGYASIKFEMEALAPLVAAEKGYAETDYKSVIRYLKEEGIPGDELEAYYAKTIADLEDIARKHAIISVPVRDAQIRIMDEAETAANPAPNVQPPRFVGGDEKIYPTFRLPLVKKNGDGTWQTTDDTYKASTWTLAAHEARPGHEMQFSAMLDQGVSLARQLYAFNSVNVEGWALYAEAISKPYMPLDGQLISLQNRLVRAARAFLDPMLNLGLITPADAKRLLIEDVMIDEGWAQDEIERYTYRMPGQATAYYYGYSRLMALRAEVELKLRDKFVQKDFHDFILSQGLLPPSLMHKAVMEQFVPEALAK
ncbi:DUF885 domain-containing protein [Kordiimonas aestuarii]|uniref:DUF885 domain-containing protein n=1 Tax=Kordiimonas aestuarii TaxID=1005925 RepID=UPI0021D3AE29|nr:DUF885 domain-containing protein [Kordiimonas aestuarii]